MAVESHFGIELDLISFPTETKKKIIEIRNQKIKDGEPNWTMTDALVYAVNMSHLVIMKQAQIKEPINKPSPANSFMPKTPDLGRGERNEK